MDVITFKHPQSLAFIHKMFDAYLATGQIRREELLLAHYTALDLQNVTTLPEPPANLHLGDAKIEDIGPGGVTLNLNGS